MLLKLDIDLEWWRINVSVILVNGHGFSVEVKSDFDERHPRKLSFRLQIMMQAPGNILRLGNNPFRLAAPSNCETSVNGYIINESNRTVANNI